MSKIKSSFELEREVHTEFKTACVKNEKTMKDVIVEFVNVYINQNNGPQRPPQKE